jgi:hypothetical protein
MMGDKYVIIFITINTTATSDRYILIVFWIWHKYSFRFCSYEIFNITVAYALKSALCKKNFRCSYRWTGNVSALLVFVLLQYLQGVPSFLFQLDLLSVSISSVLLVFGESRETGTFSYMFWIFILFIKILLGHYAHSSSDTSDSSGLI